MRRLGSNPPVTTAIAYDAANRVTAIASQLGFGRSIYPLGTDTYVYNKAGLVTSEQILSGSTLAVSLTYDADNGLTNVQGSELGNSVNVTYSYDSAGNRNSTGYSTSTGNEQTSSPGASYTYDHDGNLVSEVTSTGTTTFTYDFRNRLTAVTVNGTVVANYTYDALNRRIGINDNGSQTWVVYDGANAYADFNGSGGLLDRYLYGPAVDEILARTSSGGTTDWYLTDKEGSVNGIYESGTTLLDTIVYDSFGQVLTETNATAADRFKYAGMEYDAAIAIYYDQARDYNPVTGRFLQQDPLGLAAGDVNDYRYVGNDPATLIDPSGLYPPTKLPDKGNAAPPGTPGQQSTPDNCCCCYVTALLAAPQVLPQASPKPARRGGPTTMGAPPSGRSAPSASSPASNAQPPAPPLPTHQGNEVNPGAELPALRYYLPAITGMTDAEIAEADRIAAAIQNTFDKNATSLWIRNDILTLGLGTEQRRKGYYCYEWTYAFQDAFNFETSGKYDEGSNVNSSSKNFTSNIQSASAGEPVHYWLKITCKKTGGSIYIDDGFADGNYVHKRAPIPRGYVLGNPNDMPRNQCNPPPAYNSHGKSAVPPNPYRFLTNNTPPNETIPDESY